MYHYLFEFLGTLIFTYVILATANPLAIGATFALIKLLTLNLTPGYLNPAITITLASAGVISSTDVLFFCVVQVFGGLVALELFKRYKL
jgi:glycerol uptake facilitator-like aquaporin